MKNFWVRVIFVITGLLIGLSATPITVTAASFTIPVSENAMVKQSSPNAPFSAQQTLYVSQSSSDVIEAFLKFNLANVDPAQVQSVYLQLVPLTAGSQLNLNHTGPSWTASTINFTNSRTLSSTKVRDLPSHAANTAMTVDVTDVVLGSVPAGVVSFSLTEALAQSDGFAARDAATGAPVLYVVTTSSSSPSPTTTASTTTTAGTVASLSPTPQFEQPLLYHVTIYPTPTKPPSLSTQNSGFGLSAPTGPTPMVIKRDVVGVTPAEIPPYRITNVNTNMELKGKMYIEFSGPAGARVDMYAQLADKPENKLYIGTGTIDATTLKGVIVWNTANVPNGPYVVVLSQETKLLPGGVPIFVQNPVAANVTPPTQKDLVFPDQLPDVKQIPVSNSTKVETIANVKKDDKATGIKISGKSEPNKLITVFVYSNPIVVTVQTDANGVWTYTLEKPLEPGEHTTYAVVAQADGTTVRSEIANFKVAQVSAAEPGEANLQLESTTDWRPYLTYGVAAVILVFGGIVVLIMMYRRIVLRNEPAVVVSTNTLLDPPTK